VVFMASLLDDTRVVQEDSPESLIRQQPIQIRQCRDGDQRGADLHAGARGPIDHPGRDHDRHARPAFDDDHVGAAALLAVNPAQTAPMQRMPAIMDFDLIPDMGRMTQ
jgi:hypothetical protein